MMVYRSLKGAALGVAASLLIAGAALAQGSPDRYPYIPETDPIAQSRSQPITRAAPGPMMEYPDTDPQPASRFQRVTHQPPLPSSTLSDRVELTVPPLMKGR